MASKKDIWTVAECLQWTIGYFTRHGINEAKADAESILACVLNTRRLNLILIKDSIISPKQLAIIRDMILSRKLRKPLSYIVGEKEFYGLKIKTDPSVLIPRPETEILVEKAIDFIKHTGSDSALDICTGSGIIAIALAKFTNIKTVFAADTDINALKTAQRNCDNNGVTSKVFLKHGDMFGALGNEDIKFDLILSNPPYISKKEMLELAPELKFEPETALYGGVDGMDFYRVIADNAKDYLAQSGRIFIEISSTLAETIKKLFINKGYAIVEIVKDYSGLDRVLILGI